MLRQPQAVSSSRSAWAVKFILHNPPLPFATTTPGIAGYLIGEQFTSIELQYIGNGRFLPISHTGTIVGY
ncbi:MAG TPA: hypothetical protein PKY59_06250 [Pyrinomonadaceae bacterium]|nr:hypothetical protein [Pyrinomonadaceae bacterium]